jgi:hypothetical protein
VSGKVQRDVPRANGVHFSYRSNCSTHFTWKFNKVTVSLGTFTEIVDGGNIAELEQSIRAIMDQSWAANAAYRALVKSDVDDDAHILLATTNGVAIASAQPAAKREDDLWLDIGCVSKLLTAMTFLSVFKKEPSILKSRAELLLELEGPHGFSEAGVEDLLNHTHGLDVPILATVPRLPDGKIDVAMVFAMAGENLVSLPSKKLFSYSNAGSWFLAAIIEKNFGMRFVEVVRHVFPNLFPPHTSDDDLCPALGNGVRVNGEQLLLECVRATAFITGRESRYVILGPAFSLPYPGWHPQERGVCQGWKEYANRWYGHQAILTRTPMLLRVCPSDGIGFVITSRSVHPWRFLQEVFSQDLIGKPEPPSGAAHMRARNQGLVRCVGVYEHGRSRMRVSFDASGFKMELESKSHVQTNTKAVMHESRLQPVAPGMFKVSLPPLVGDVSENIGLLELVYDSDGRVSHFWQSGILWRRCI